ncbi:hypothetical protein RHSIM_Rhsim05G0073000 [Rhododendron simsii]|uniref:Uncharacterized protein n=1 Tax=Rhododendron simsii TaxID=118357 RepID=A0A834GYL9_RHOSS|nr:hypothetical protein RHSIM_Rhsim05G0073000 [Rhododendron simsii]
MKKLSSTLSTIEAVLEDAERNHLEDSVVQDWLRKLKDAAYEVDDILDECSTEILRWESKGQSSGSLKKVDKEKIIKVLLEDALERDEEVSVYPIIGDTCQVSDLDSLRKKLREMLNGKRYLIVLDDVWDEGQEKWDKLRYTIACGSKGSSIIVTTRVEKPKADGYVSAVRFGPEPRGVLDSGSS